LHILEIRFLVKQAFIADLQLFLQNQKID